MQRDKQDIMKLQRDLKTTGIMLSILMGLTLLALIPQKAIADSTSAEAALGHLIGNLKDATCGCFESEQPRQGMGSKNLQSSILAELGEVKTSHYRVRSGDTLDSIIKGHLASSPVHKAILRQAIVLANPHAFKRNNPHWLYANREIKLPEAKDIHRAVFKQSLVQIEVLARTKNKKKWVRYP